jgi:hypothetical protein
MRDLRLTPHCLFFFSDDDPLCDPTKLEQLVEARRARHGSAATQELRWQHSRHVCHLLCHYKEYSAALFAFLEGCKLKPS